MSIWHRGDHVVTASTRATTLMKGLGRALLCLLALAAARTSGQAQNPAITYPSQTARVLVGFSAGSARDVRAPALATQAAAVFRRHVGAAGEAVAAGVIKPNRAPRSRRPESS